MHLQIGGLVVIEPELSEIFPPETSIDDDPHVNWMPEDEICNLASPVDNTIESDDIFI